MPVVGPHGQAGVFAGLRAAFLFFHQRGDHGGHVGRTFQMVCLEEAAVGFALHVAQVQEMDAAAQAADDAHEVMDLYNCDTYSP